MFKCISCKGERADTRTLKDAKDKNKIDVALCETCGLVQLVDVQDQQDLTDYYRTDYRLDYKGTNAPRMYHIYRAGQVAAERLEMIKKFAGPGTSVLDVGAGGGEFTFLAGEMGYDAHGIDPSSGYVEFARENYGADLRPIGIEELEKNKKFQFITLFHVLEHLPNPGDAINALSDHLEDGGYLFIEVPDLRSRDTSPYNFFHKAHVSYFTDLTLIQLMRRNFEICETRSGRVLQVIGRKRTEQLELDEQEIAAERAESVRVSKERWQNKNFAEYVRNGALKSPFRKLRRIADERIEIRGKKPREILEAFL